MAERVTYRQRPFHSILIYPFRIPAFPFPRHEEASSHHLRLCLSHDSLVPGTEQWRNNTAKEKRFAKCRRIVSLKFWTHLSLEDDGTVLSMGHASVIQYAIGATKPQRQVLCFFTSTHPHHASNAFSGWPSCAWCFQWHQPLLAPRMPKLSLIISELKTTSIGCSSTSANVLRCGWVGKTPQIKLWAKMAYEY